jgi:hypothetical protein
VCNIFFNADRNGTIVNVFYISIIFYFRGGEDEKSKAWKELTDGRYIYLS